MAVPPEFTRGVSQGHDFTRLTFRVNAELSKGEQLFIMGSCNSLGGFNPNRAIEMVTTPERYPTWTTPKSVLVPMFARIQYNYAVFCGGEFHRWEGGRARGRERRRLILPKEKYLSIEDEFGVFGESLNRRPSLREKKNTEDEEDFDIVAQYKKRGQKVLLISNYLPLKIIRHPSTSSSSSSSSGRYRWVATWKTSNIIAKNPRGSISERIETRWIGMVHTRYIRTNEGKEVDPKSLTNSDKEDITRTLRKLGCEPLWIDLSVEKQFFDGYCKQVLWPTLHNVLSLYGPIWNRELSLNTRQMSSFFDAYRNVNMAFANKILSMMSSPSDLLWIHDYHLMLLPRLIRGEIQKRWPSDPRPPAIVFFFHCAFPTSEIFRVLPQRHELVEGILGADMLGFHSYNHARHFLNTSKRLLGLKRQSRRGGMLAVEHEGRSVGAIIIHVGIDSGYLDYRLGTDEAKHHEALLRGKYSNRTILVGLDQCQRLQGIALKLLAFERLLEECEELRDKVVLVQRCRLPMQRSKDTEMTRDEVHKLISRIRDSFGNDVIDYKEAPIFPMNERLGIFSAADVMISTPVGSEHLNMNPLEYVYCHRADSNRSPGVVVLSEFAMPSEVMNGAIIVNPFNLSSVTRALEKAVRMSKQERGLRIARDIDHVKLASSKWSRRVLEALDEVWSPAAGSYAMAQLNELVDIDAVAEDSGARPKINQRSNIREQNAQLSTHEISEFSALNASHLADVYRVSRKRLLIFNYTGTLVPNSRKSLNAWKCTLKRNLIHERADVRAPETVLQTLRKLCADPLNTVFVISGMSPDAIDAAVGSIENLNVIARNGYGISFAANLKSSECSKEIRNGIQINISSKNNRDWYRMRSSEDVGANWQDRAYHVMKNYSWKVNGSTIHRERWQVRWDYRGCNLEWASTQVPHLIERLEDELPVLLTTRLQVLRLAEQISVLPRWVRKGAAVKCILKLINMSPDFVLCIGDDATDDEMFTALYSHLEDSDNDADDEVMSVDSESKDDDEAESYLFACTVGVKASTARLCIQDVAEVGHRLDELASISSGDDGNRMEI